MGGVSVKGGRGLAGECLPNANFPDASASCTPCTDSLESLNKLHHAHASRHHDSLTYCAGRAGLSMPAYCTTDKKVKYFIQRVECIMYLVIRELLECLPDQGADAGVLIRAGDDLRLPLEREARPPHCQHIAWTPHTVLTHAAFQASIPQHLAALLRPSGSPSACRTRIAHECRRWQ